MSRYPPTDYRGPRERSRSPPRFSDHRGSAASAFPPRNADAPRGPRSLFDPAPRPSISGGPGLGPGPASRPPAGYASLRDAPPLSMLGGAERGRPFRERDYDRAHRPPSPRERTPPRPFKDPRDSRDPRDYPPRELDIARARRASREGPPSAGSNYSDNPPFASAPFRGGFGRGRGRGDFEFRGGRAGRRPFDEREREVLRRERSPPLPRWGRELSRDGRDLPLDGRESERREERRFDRREEDRRPAPDWYDRERELDRSRRDQVPPRLEARRSDESIANAPLPQQSAPVLQIDPGRLALLEQAGADLSVRRPSLAPQPPKPPVTPSYLNGRAETTANRYKQRDSSPPTQAPPVPAFTLSFAPSAPTPAFGSVVPPPAAPKQAVEPKVSSDPYIDPAAKGSQRHVDDRPGESQQHGVEHKAPPPAPRVELMQPPPAAPKAPRAFEEEQYAGFGSRLHGVRSLEDIAAHNPSLNVPGTARHEPSPRASPSIPRAVSAAVTLSQPPTVAVPASPIVQGSRPGELAAPTGPRATRMSPAQASVSPRPAFASPRSDIGSFQSFSALTRGQTPPPTAPLGPRNRSFSVSPKVTASSIPTAPKGIRAPPLAPRGVDRPQGGMGRGLDRLGAPPPWAPPIAPRGLQWNQWRRPGPGGFVDKLVPAKRDFSGEERSQDSTIPKGEAQPSLIHQQRADFIRTDCTEQSPHDRAMQPTTGRATPSEKMELDIEPASRAQQPAPAEHSAKQSFFGKPEEPAEEDASMSEAADEPISSSEEDDMDAQQDLALRKAKFERQKRALEAKKIDLSARAYRATTPLESIARLTRISEKDLQRFLEQHEMDVDDSPTDAANNLMAPTTLSSGTDEGRDVDTPKGEEDAVVDVRSSGGESSEDVRRVRRPSPEIISLPYLVKDARPFEDGAAFQETLQRQQECKSAVVVAIKQEIEGEYAVEDDADAGYDGAYRRWREACENLEREREAQERLERQLSAEPNPEVLLPVAPPINPIVEGRRLHKYSSEYDVEQVLKQSEETARLEQEKYERETRKLQADMEKEAKVADQQLEEHIKRTVFVDANRQREPDTLTLVFSYEPQADTFTENEQRIFVGAFKETPKKWSEIASLLPGRTYKDCIHHYYANKWDGRFRDNRMKKLKAGGRRGRGGKAVRGRGAAAMADLTSAEEILPQSVSESGRPRRAAAPTTFGEREAESKATLVNPSPAKRPGPGTKADANGDQGLEKPGKRRKGMGEKTGRKGKATQQLAALAAAPSAASLSPSKHFMQTMPINEEMARAQSLEEASLLAGLHSGHHIMFPPPEPHAVYHQEEYVPSIMPSEDTVRSKVAAQSSSARSGASSYWSVPEQQDFAKYIAHFGTDFAAIANHMGTKTQVMIKNHYGRQVASGTLALENAAREADRRREVGAEIGPPPTPTPIVKRKYDQPQPTAPRPLAPHTEAMDVDEPLMHQRALPSKHVSSPQYQAQPRFTSSAQATPIPAHRAVPSPVPSVASPAEPKSQPAAPTRPMPHPLGAGLAFTPDSRPESRPGIQTPSSFRHSHSQENVPRSQPQRPDHKFLENLAREQNKAFRMQQEQSQQERLGNGSFQRGSAQGSPATLPLQEIANERKPLFEERAPTPPVSTIAQSPFSRPSLATPTLPGFHQAPFASSMLNRSLNVSSPKKEELRPGSVPTIPPMRQAVDSAPPAPQPPAPAPAKRSNLLSILNDDTEEPRPPKKESLPSLPQRIPSPAPSNTSHAPGPSASALAQGLRRETFGQPSIPQSHFHRSSFSHPGQQFAATPSSVKQEPTTTAPPGPALPKPDWAARVLGQPPQGAPPSQPSPPPTVERDPRSYFPHRASVLGALNQPMRANPSPPPHLVHSRTPSLTQAREQRQPLQSLPQSRAEQGSSHALHPNPYAHQSMNTPFAQPLQPEARNHSHHSHNSSLSAGFPGLHHRAASRDDLLRQEQQAIAAQREREQIALHQREEIEWRRREEMERRELHERRGHEERQREAQYMAQRQRQQEEDMFERDRQQHHQQMFGQRGPPPQQPLQPPAFGGPAFTHEGGFGSLREQAAREANARMRDEERLREQRERDHAAVDEMRRRQQQHEELSRRQTPLGGYYAHPPPPRR